ncbi:MAG: hypothetical protein U5R49_13640 [Deltaproteobacteria bacterium]|nr:hypothetical protein [Deltaproteobacteria bacterium]
MKKTELFNVCERITRLSKALEKGEFDKGPEELCSILEDLGDELQSIASEIRELTSPEPQPMRPGTQIVYMPDQAKGDLNHSDVMFGFVVAHKGEFFHWCHFWSKNKPEILRTRKSPDMVPNDNLIRKKTVPQKQVDEMMAKLKIPK